MSEIKTGSVELWVAQHRGTRTDIKSGTDYFRVGTELEVADPDAVCIHVFGARKAEKAAHIVKCVNAHDELIDALETLRSDCQTPIDMYERNGPEFTSPHGNEYESTSYVMDKFAELVASIDGALVKARDAS